MKKQIGMKIKAVAIATILMLVFTTIVVGKETQIFAKEERLAPLGAGPPSDTSVHIGGGNNDASIVKTVEINSDADDGHLYKAASSYVDGHDSLTGTVFDTLTGLFVGQRKISLYYMYRTGLFFDTSSIPTNSVITSAKLTFVLTADFSTTDFDIVVQNGQPTYPRKPMVLSDYSYLLYSGDGGSYDTSGLPAVNNPFDIELNPTGINWINKGGTTKLMLRSSNDINGVPPTGDERILIYSFEQGTTFIPKLTVSYYTPSQPIRILGVHIGGG